MMAIMIGGNLDFGVTIHIIIKTPNLLEYQKPRILRKSLKSASKFPL